MLSKVLLLITHKFGYIFRTLRSGWHQIFSEVQDTFSLLLLESWDGHSQLAMETIGTVIINVGLAIVSKAFPLCFIIPLLSSSFAKTRLRSPFKKQQLLVKILNLWTN